MRIARWILGLGIALSLAAVGFWRLTEQRKAGSPPPLSAAAPQPTTESAPVAPPAPAAAPVDPFAATDVRLPLEPPTLEGTATVRVRILSKKEGEPLAGAVAGLLLPSENPRAALVTATSDASGIATFTAVRPGTFSVCARGAGHAQACEKDVGVVGGGTLPVELRLAPGATLVGSVRRKDGTPAAGIRVVATGGSLIPDLVAPEVVTDAQGAFRLEGLVPLGLYSAELHTPEGPVAHRNVPVLEDGRETRLDIQDLASFVPLTVTPLWRREKQQDAKVTVSVAGVPLAAQPDGTFQGLIEEGKHTLYANDSLSRSAHREVTLAAGKPQQVKLTLARQRSPVLAMADRELPIPEPFEVAGHVVLADGTLVKRMHVSYEEPPRYARMCGNVPRQFSHFRFEGSAFVLRPPGGQRTLYAWLEDGRLGRVTLNGSPGQRVVVNITLEETGAVAGRLPPGWREYPTDLIVDDQWLAPFHFTAEDGSFLVAGLKPGEHVLEHGQTPFTVRARERTDLGLLPPPKAP